MNRMKAFVEEVMVKSDNVRSALAKDPAVGAWVDLKLPIPKPYFPTPSKQIKLVIIGQDPTVQNENSRHKIQTVLNLDKSGQLKNFVEKLCDGLGLSLDDNVYATNACKNFFRRPPTTIKNVNVLQASASFWLPILRTELDQFPEATIISLGEPVLTILVREPFSREMKYYWGYHRQWRSGKTNTMSFIKAQESTIGKRIFPFVHEPTMRGSRTEFYRCGMQDYIDLISRESGRQT
ncbi:MAG: uracil-DNA glycosylase family protein [bacterium]